CGHNLLEVNASKSWIMVFGPIPEDLPKFMMNGLTVAFTEKFCYVGVTFCSTHKNIFAAGYTVKAQTARNTAFTVLGVEAFIKDLPPKEGRLLYMSCIDPHLISGCDVVLDVDSVALAELEKVQKSFMRRLLGLGAYSMRAPLYTELGLLPLRYRRLILAVRYVKYVIGLEHTHYAWLAMSDSWELYQQGFQGYWMDLGYALGSLPMPVTIPGMGSLTGDDCEAVCKAIYASAMKSLEAEITASARLYLLHGRLEPLEDAPPRRITAVLRHYLTLVVNANHRRAITRLLLSQHNLAVERLRHSARRKEPVPRHLRLCRFGCNKLESVEHALLLCTRSLDLVQKRSRFIAAVSSKVPSIQTVNHDTATVVLKTLIFNRETVCQVAKFAWQAFRVYDTLPLRRP
ncbi:hypothetical protein C8R43DRAFT_875940, partial [Mycena crocata]